MVHHIRMQHSSIERWNFFLIENVPFFQHIFCANDPAANSFMSEKEKNYLLQSLGQLQQNEDQAPAPWKAIFTSKPAVALIITYVKTKNLYHKKRKKRNGK